MQGDITVSTDEGMKRLIGQHVMATKAGNKRVGLAHADTIWTTVCHTNLTDIEAIEEELVEESETDSGETISVVPITSKMQFSPVGIPGKPQVKELEDGSIVT